MSSHRLNIFRGCGIRCGLPLPSEMSEGIRLSKDASGLIGVVEDKISFTICRSASSLLIVRRVLGVVYASAIRFSRESSASPIPKSDVRIFFKGEDELIRPL